MIQSFSCKETHKIAKGLVSHKLPINLQHIIARKLAMMDAAETLEDLRVPPGNRLEALKGNRKGWYSIRVNTQWRICFQWISKGPTNVEVIDYH